MRRTGDSDPAADHTGQPTPALRTNLPPAHPRTRSRWSDPSLRTIPEASRVIAFHREGAFAGPTITPPRSSSSLPQPAAILTPLSHRSDKTPSLPSTGLTDDHPTGAATGDSDAFFPTIPGYTRHHLQSLPSPAALELLDGVLARPVMDWTIEDFTTPLDTTGTSVLMSIFVDFAHAIRPEGLTSSQRGMLAWTAKITHPAQLLSFIQNRARATGFITDILSKAPRPPLQEDKLCPAETSELIQNDGLRGRIHSPGLTRGDLLQITLSFARCIYPLDSGLSAAIRQLSQSEISTLVHTPGAFAHLAQSRNSLFSPPTWLLLSRPEATTTVNDPPIMSRIELRPLEHLGMSPSAFFLLPPTQQKTVTLSSLYSYLDTKLPPKQVIDTLIQFGNAPPEMIASMLHPDNFHSMLGLPPPSPTGKLFRIRLILQHNGRGGSRHWKISPGAVVQQWLMAVLPVFATKSYSISLTTSPYDTPRELPVTRDMLPTVDELHHFAHRTRMDGGRLRRLELWVITSCPDLGEDLSEVIPEAKALNQYTSMLASSRIRCQQKENYLADTIPCVLLANSIPRDIDALIMAELQTRILAADLAEKDIPFYVSWCSISTSNDNLSTMAKCVLAHPLVASAMTAIFQELPSGPDEECLYPITG